MRIEAVGQPGVSAIHRHGVLGQVVGSHAEERAHLGQPVRHEYRRRCLDHHPDRDRLCALFPALLSAAASSATISSVSRTSWTVVIRGSISWISWLDRGPEHGADLGPEHLRLIETDPNGAPAQEWIGLYRCLERRRELVASQIERPDHHRLVGECAGHPPEVVGLLVFGRQLARPVSRNSVRRSPTPWAPCRLAASISSGRSTFPIRVWPYPMA